MPSRVPVLQPLEQTRAEPHFKQEKVAAEHRFSNLTARTRENWHSADTKATQEISAVSNRNTMNPTLRNGSAALLITVVQNLTEIAG